MTCKYLRMNRKELWSCPKCRMSGAGNQYTKDLYINNRGEYANLNKSITRPMAREDDMGELPQVA